jgi:hypothetical protein
MKARDPTGGAGDALYACTPSSQGSISGTSTTFTICAAVATRAPGERRWLIVLRREWRSGNALCETSGCGRCGPTVCLPRSLIGDQLSEAALELKAWVRGENLSDELRRQIAEAVAGDVDAVACQRR